MFPKLKKITVLPDYKILLEYKDGAKGVFDFPKTLSFKGDFAKLRDPAEFGKARISRDIQKCLTWPGQLDLDPVQVYSDVTGKSIDWILDKDDPQPGNRQRSRQRIVKSTVVGRGSS